VLAALAPPRFAVLRRTTAPETAPPPEPKPRLGHARAFRARRRSPFTPLTLDGKTIVSAVPGFSALHFARDRARSKAGCARRKVDRRGFDRNPARYHTLLAGGKNGFSSITPITVKAETGVYDTVTGEVLFTFDSYVLAISGDGLRAMVSLASEAADEKQLVSRGSTPRPGRHSRSFKGRRTKTSVVECSPLTVAASAAAPILHQSGSDLRRDHHRQGNSPNSPDDGFQVLGRSLSSSPDGKVIVTSADEGAIQIWDTPRRGKLLSRSHTEARRLRTKLVFDPDGLARGRGPSPRAPSFQVWKRKDRRIHREAANSNGVRAGPSPLPHGSVWVSALGKHETERRIPDEIRRNGPSAATQITPTGGHTSRAILPQCSSHQMGSTF